MIPRETLDTVRTLAEVHQPARHEFRKAGEGLPVVVIHLGARAGRRIAAKVASEVFDGITVVEDPELGVLVTAITRAGKTHGVMGGELEGEDLAGLRRFERRRRETDGAHALLVREEPRHPARTPRVFGLFESVPRDELRRTPT